MTRIEKLQNTGIRRLGRPSRGFRYLTADGRKPAAADLARIRSLVLPPAWADVAIASSPTSAVQAILGNTPAVCRSSYIYPSVLDSFERGRTIERSAGSVAELVASGRRLRRSEKALLKLLKRKAA